MSGIWRCIWMFHKDSCFSSWKRYLFITKKCLSSVASVDCWWNHWTKDLRTISMLLFLGLIDTKRENEKDESRCCHFYFDFEIARVKTSFQGIEEDFPTISNRSECQTLRKFRIWLQFLLSISSRRPSPNVMLLYESIWSLPHAMRLQSHNTMNITIEILQYCLPLSIEILSHVELKSETKISFWLECVEIIKISILQCHACVWAWYLWVFTLTVMIFALRLSSYRVSDEIILK